MDYPIHIDISSMKLSALYFKGSQLNLLNFNIFLLLKIVLILENSADPDKMPPFQK